MSDLDEVMKAQIARNAESLVHAIEIAKKSKNDEASGWYTTERPQLQQLELSPAFLQKGAELLQKTFSQNLAAYICGIDEPRLFGKWVKGTVIPNSFQASRLRAAIEVTEILLANLTPAQAKAWMTAPNTYLAVLGALPMDELAEGHSERVRRAALYFFV